MDINKVGQALYGDNWRAPLAKALDVNERTVRRWADGEITLSEKIKPELIKLIDQNIQTLNKAKKETTMKVGVDFIGYNAGEFYGHSIKKNENNPEYYVVLQADDRLLDDGTLIRGGLSYTHVEKMTGFRGVAFVNVDDFNEPDTIACKLIKA
jgi:hypothetical protein